MTTHLPNVPPVPDHRCETVRYDAGGQNPVVVPAHHYVKRDGVWTCLHCGAHPCRPVLSGSRRRCLAHPYQDWPCPHEDGPR